MTENIVGKLLALSFFAESIDHFLHQPPERIAMALAAGNIPLRMTEVIVFLSSVIHISLAIVINGKRYQIIPSAIERFHTFAIDHIAVQLSVLGDGQTLQRAIPVPLEEKQPRIGPGGVVISDRQDFSLPVEHISRGALEDSLVRGRIFLEYRLAYIPFKSKSFAAQVRGVRIERQHLCAKAEQNRQNCKQMFHNR